MNIPIIPVTVTVNDQNAGRGGAKNQRVIV